MSSSGPASHQEEKPRCTGIPGGYRNCAWLPSTAGIVKENSCVGRDVHVYRWAVSVGRPKIRGTPGNKRVKHHEPNLFTIMILQLTRNAQSDRKGLKELRNRKVRRINFFCYHGEKDSKRHDTLSYHLRRHDGAALMLFGTAWNYFHKDCEYTPVNVRPVERRHGVTLM